MKISLLTLSTQKALLSKNVILSNLISYNSMTMYNLTIDQTCTSSSCSSHTIILTQGIYKIELWGSQGGTASYAAAPGNGSYVSGNFTALNGTTLYAFIGNGYGYNGGGSGGSAPNTGGRGGGATDIRFGGTGLDNRIMVAAGGGGGGGHSNGGSPSSRSASIGTSGGNGDEDGSPTSDSYYGKPGRKGTQASGGSGGTYGSAYSSRPDPDGTYYPSGGGGGGGGYYGGGGGGSGGTGGASYESSGRTGSSGSKGTGGSGASGAYSSTISARWSFPGGGGGGGSSYIDTTRVSIIQMLNGNTPFLNVIGETTIGNRRNGAIRIEQISEEEEGNVCKCTCNYNVIFTMQKLYKVSTLIFISLLK
jgi:hypothetical protein